MILSPEIENVVGRTQATDDLLRKVFPENLPKIATHNSSELQLHKVGRRPQLLAQVSTNVWEIVWEKFGSCQHKGPIPSEVMAECMGKHNAMAAGVQVFMEDVQAVQFMGFGRGR